MSIEKTDAVSLGNINYSETSKIVTFLTRDFGHIKCIAKGCRKKGSKFGNSLEPGSVSSVVFYFKARGGLFTLKEAELISFFPRGRSEFSRSMYTQMPLAIITKTILPAYQYATAFETLVRFLNATESSSSDQECAFHLLTYIKRLCDLLGFGLSLSGCRLCGKDNAGIVFSAREGSFYCLDCRPTAHGLKMGTASILKSAGFNPKLKLLPIAEFNNAIEILIDYLCKHTEMSIKMPLSAALRE